MVGLISINTTKIICGSYNFADHGLQIEEIYELCFLSCSHEDNICLSECSREYLDNQKECPCQENCPNGCPCPNYTCQETTTPIETTTSAEAPKGIKTVLVLNSDGIYNWRPALLIDSTGRQKGNSHLCRSFCSKSLRSVVKVLFVVKSSPVVKSFKGVSVSTLYFARTLKTQFVFCPNSIFSRAKY